MSQEIIENIGAEEEQKSFSFVDREVQSESDSEMSESEQQSNENISESPVQTKLIVIREGDVFVFEDGVIALIVLGVSDVTSVGSIYKVKLASVVSKSVDVSEDELVQYINKNNLTKLNTFTDQIESLNDVLVLEQGDVLTQKGEFFMEILSNEVLFIDSIGGNKNIIGVRMNDGSVAYREALWIKGQIYGNTDQFPSGN